MSDKSIGFWDGYLSKEAEDPPNQRVSSGFKAVADREKWDDVRRDAEYAELQGNVEKQLEDDFFYGVAADDSKRKLATSGAGAGLGAILGGLMGGKRGAAVGGILGTILGFVGQATGMIPEDVWEWVMKWRENGKLGGEVKRMSAELTAAAEGTPEVTPAGPNPQMNTPMEDSNSLTPTSAKIPHPEVTPPEVTPENPHDWRDPTAPWPSRHYPDEDDILSFIGRDSQTILDQAEGVAAMPPPLDPQGGGRSVGNNPLTGRPYRHHYAGRYGERRHPEGYPELPPIGVGNAIIAAIAAGGNPVITAIHASERLAAQKPGTPEAKRAQTELDQANVVAKEDKVAGPALDAYNQNAPADSSSRQRAHRDAARGDGPEVPAEVTPVEDSSSISPEERARAGRRAARGDGPEVPAEVVDPAAEVVDPAADAVDPAAEVVDPAAAATSAKDQPSYTVSNQTVGDQTGVHTLGGEPPANEDIPFTPPPDPQRYGRRFKWDIPGQLAAKRQAEEASVAQSPVAGAAGAGVPAAVSAVTGQPTAGTGQPTAGTGQPASEDFFARMKADFPKFESALKNDRFRKDWDPQFAERESERREEQRALAGKPLEQPTTTPETKKNWAKIFTGRKTDQRGNPMIWETTPHGPLLRPKVTPEHRTTETPKVPPSQVQPQKLRGPRSLITGTGKLNKWTEGSGAAEVLSMPWYAAQKLADAAQIQQAPVEPVQQAPTKKDVFDREVKEVDHTAKMEDYKMQMGLIGAKTQAGQAAADQATQTSQAKATEAAQPAVGTGQSTVGTGQSTVGTNPSTAGTNPSTVGTNPSTVGMDQSTAGTEPTAMAGSMSMDQPMPEAQWTAPTTV